MESKSIDVKLPRQVEQDVKIEQSIRVKNVMLIDKHVIIKYRTMINWINSWNSGNKKEIYEINLRLGMLTLFQLRFCFCSSCNSTRCSRFRFMLFNFGFEI